jgi:hypothetical protein
VSAVAGRNPIFDLTSETAPASGLVAKVVTLYAYEGIKVATGNFGFESGGAKYTRRELTMEFGGNIRAISWFT